MEHRGQVAVEERPAAGLTEAEASTRLQRDGPNAIVREQARSPIHILLTQLASPLIWLLVGAAGISALMGEWVDGIAITAIVLLNAIVGFLQEYRAERAVLALRSMTAPRARVLRDGHSRIVPASQVVAGDVLLLEQGDLVAADAHLLEANRLSTNEAALTGESLPVEKSPEPVAPGAPLAERTDEVFMGTAVSTGSGRAEVTRTGMNTELGRIARLIQTAQEEKTPLQQRLAVLGRTLLYLCIAVVALVAALGFLHGENWETLLLSAISLAVAVVPEGLPAVVTIALAVGVQRMARRNVLVRKMAAVETLGTTTVICTDKTGTLTTGKMEVRETWGPDVHALLYAAAASSDAELGDGVGLHADDVGDPTEIALLRAARRGGIERDAIERANPRVCVNPFDSTRKRMSIQRADGVLYVKGAIDSLVPLCAVPLPGVVEENARMAARGLRVLGVAIGRGEREEQLQLLGLVGLADPPRREAIDAVKAARDAGIHTVMITGDHPVTARAIAEEMGIIRPGEEVARLVHARATAEDKLKIVREWKAQGEVVAMTGDGVNDAPALREAHIGVAMGKTGTEVTREASDMVLADDNFASIVAAVREGRTIFENIRKTLIYLLSGNASELLVMLGASLLGWPIPLLPLQLLYINLITDGFPALALVADPSQPDVLSAPPRRSTEAMLGQPQWLRIGLIGAVEGLVVLVAYGLALRMHGVEHARTLAFTVIVFAELFRSFAARSDRRTFWEVGAFTNLTLLGVIAISVGLMAILHGVPQMRAIFGLAVFSLREAAIAVGLGWVPVTLVEVSKLVRRRGIRASTGSA